MKMEILDKYRVTTGLYKSERGSDFGAFIVPFEGIELRIICAPMESSEWEHVSVSISHRCPNHKEMSFVKSLFWDDEHTCVHFYPKKSEHVNNHPFCLHLWRHKKGHDLPPSILVGVK